MEHLIATTNQTDLPLLINAVGCNGQTALHKAAFYGHDRVIELLIASGATVDARDSERAVALHKAAARGHVAAVKACVGSESMALMTVCDTENGTALRLAAVNGHMETVRVSVCV